MNPIPSQPKYVCRECGATAHEAEMGTPCPKSFPAKPSKLISTGP